MKFIILAIITVLIAGSLLPSTMAYGITTFLNGACILGACVLSYNLGALSK
jgi:hypothetical protein